MANAAVVECYATLVDPFGSTDGRPSPHRGADYRRGAGETVVAYEACTVVDSDLKSQYLGYSLVARRHRDGKYIGWAHLRLGSRPGNGTVLEAGDQVGTVAGWDDYHGSSWSGPHIHTTEGTTPEHIYVGQNSDPAPDIAAARGGASGGGSGSTGVVNYHWYNLSVTAMHKMQGLAKRLGIYGVLYGDGTVDGDFGENSVKSWQELGKRWGFLPADYEIDGTPHNLDQEAPSNYGFFLQNWAKEKAGYDGLLDGLPGPYTSEFLARACDQVNAELDGPIVSPPVTPPVVIPKFPSVPEGYIFFPDIGTSQGDFDFQEYKAAGGSFAFIKLGGSNASDSPYIAPRALDQQSRARTAGQRIGKYWFNGNKNGLTPETSMDFFAQHLDLKPGELVALDVEDETDTGTKAWTPSEVVRAIKQLRTYYPKLNGLVYGSDSLLDDPAWKVVWDLGWEPWDASWGANTGQPGNIPTTSAPIAAWQYTSKAKVPGNYSGNPKVYGDTDGNMAKLDLWDRLGWKIPDPEPEEPEPPVNEGVSVKFIQDYLNSQATLNAEFAAALK